MTVRRQALELPAVQVAPALLGAVVQSTIGGAEVRVRLTEVEAYEGADDPASHAYRGRTPRNAVMFGEPGHLYAYFVYGMHWCANVICGPSGTAAGVLLRAGEIVEGGDVARDRTPGARRPESLASGPARLARCLGITGTESGLDLLSPTSTVRLLALADGPRRADQARGPRVGVATAADRPWRFWLAGDPTVSAYRAAAARRGPTQPTGATGRAPRGRHPAD